MRNSTNETYTKINEYIDAHKEDMITLWEKLVNTESGNMQKSGVDEVGYILKSELEKSGVNVSFATMKNMGNFLQGCWGEENTKKPVLLIGHMDTVFKEGAVAANPFRIEGNKAFGPGVLDMKAGLVIAVYVIKALSYIGYKDRPIKIAFAGDEENGHRASDASEVMLDAAKGVAAGFNFETGYLDDGLVVGRKGSYRLTIDVKGIASHSGNAPEKGRNAILEMSHKIIELQKLNDYENGTSINVGIISGGTVVNAVPDKCSIQIDIRFTKLSNLNKILESIDEIVSRTYVDGTSTFASKTKPSAVMEDTEELMKLFYHIQNTAKEIGYGDVKPIKVGGWSDSSLVASTGVPVVCGLGAKGEGNHSPKEYALVDSLFSRTKLVAASIVNLDWE